MFLLKFNFIKKILLKKTNIWLFIFSAIIILWQMLLPGYVLTLDMVFTPKLNFYFSPGDILNTLPLLYFLKLLNVFLSGWIIQKCVLIALFFCIGYLAFKFLPAPQKYYANYWAALFYTINPFVYERFLAGHWQHLYAYALLPPLIFYLFKSAKEPNWKNGAWLLCCLFLIGVLSLHFLVMAILILAIYLSCQILKNFIIKNKKQAIDIIKFTLLFSLFFLILNSYWLIPYFTRPNESLLNNINSQHSQAFQTATDQRLGTSLNVLALYGYWGENQPWLNYWLWPKDNFMFWSIITSLIFLIISFGIGFGLRHKEYRGKTISFLILGLLAFIFSCGIGNTIFKPINQWLFEHLFFWRGFRDTQKFSGLLALSYAYFGSLGFYYFANKLQKFKITKFAMIILFSLPLLYTYPMLGGFARQLQPAWYPKSWDQVNQLLREDKTDYKILFLPWHQYLSLKFNHNLITANPAKAFFDQPIIQSENMEVNNILTQSTDTTYQKINDLILNPNNLESEIIVAGLKAEHIKYIIFTQDLIAEDNLKYDFIESPGVSEILSSPEIKLFSLN
ncbi:MAG: hypothetical protein A2Y82_01905 [Candidatus Buchananbacteria bacterium RBG_13_36_9]|uniref:Glycosyltransferase RgtA/B/C/D-like domain-containing protein n=1 Tax=Candidatus Buchananbacteria bacterium RBG_13_36_9 TaxID=1797530 RepID=A0A1G1XMB8_9BACT|nr:MAG: hypothetical protein A2Y82_01905 [Candidatus Buchananbacteria bacterium RBG_13_36_9]